MTTSFMRSAACALLALMLVALPLRAQDTEEVIEPANSIVDVAEEAGTFTTLLAALDAADLTNALRGDGPFTLFAPTDEAFAKLPEGILDNLLEPENKDQLVAILTYHVVSDQAKASDAEDMAMVTTLEGNDLSITNSDGTVMVNEATVTTADIEASNGVIHVIDTVLMPPVKEKKMEDDMQ